MHLNSVIDSFYILSTLFGGAVCASGGLSSPNVPHDIVGLSARNLGAETTAFIDVNVIPMDTERVLVNQTVVVQDGQIIALGPSKQVMVPRGAVRIEGRGKYLIPGLGDMHGHFAEKDDSINVASYRLASYLANGVTTVRQIIVQHDPRRVQVLEQLKSAGMLGARLYLPERANPKAVQPGGPTAYAKMFQATGRDYILVLGQQVREFPVMDSALVAIRQLGFPVASHSHAATTDEMLALSAYDGSLEHLFAFRDVMDRPETEVSDEELRKLAESMQRTWITPTLACKEQRDSPAGSLLTARRIVKALQDAGGRLLLGADADGIHGLSPSLIHEELQALVRAGLSPYQALLSGTRNVAQYFGVLDSSGTIAVGKRADLVLLNGNPLTDIRHTVEPAGVMRVGQWLDRAALDQRLLASPKDWLEWDVWWGMIPRMSKEQKALGGHFLTFGTLTDSLAMARPSERERLVRLLTDELGAIRANLTVAQQVTFDPKARVWMREQARKGYKVVVAGVASVP